MSTNTSSASTATAWPQPLILDQVAKLSMALNFAIIPCLSAVGICGNVLSMFLLARQGFRKSSNVLLFGLTLSDALFLAGINNFSRHVQAGNVPVGFTFTEGVNYMFYIFYMILLGAYFIGGYCSILIPVLITGDRLLVVFLPLKVHTIVTPLRTLLVISCVGALIFGCFIYQYVLCLRFEQVHLVGGVVLGRIVPTEQLYQDGRSGAYWLFESIINNMTGVVPMVLVTVGCAVIGLKVTLIANRRRQLTSGGVTSRTKYRSDKTMSRSTRTLLSICLLYILCMLFTFIVAYVIRIPAVMNDLPLRIIFELLNKFVQCVNSVGNFIVYVTGNNNFSCKDLRMFCSPKKQPLMSVKCIAANTECCLCK